MYRTAPRLLAWVALVASAAWATKAVPPLEHEFAFVVPHINSTRQWGKCLNINIKYRYPGMYMDEAKLFDYKAVRKLALYYAQPTPELPQESQWELVNQAFVLDAYSRFNVSAFSSQIQVKSENNSDIQEPSNHGSIVTLGAGLSPVNEPWLTAFRYDCTKHSSPPFSDD